jgi:hypothetical protein
VRSAASDNAEFPPHFRPETLTIVRLGPTQEAADSVRRVLPLTSLDAYLERIRLAGLTDAPLALLQRAHATSIPFENFDSYWGDSGHSVASAPDDR